jgi:hypothetical protein
MLLMLLVMQRNLQQRVQHLPSAVQDFKKPLFSDYRVRNYISGLLACVA